VDARTDLYAVGLLLYVLLAGRHAFEDRQDVTEVIEAMRKDAAPPPSERALQAIPAEIDGIVLKALAWSAAERFQSAAAFAEVLRGTALLAVPARRGLPRPVFVLVAAVSAALVFGALLFTMEGRR
jgi:serine/threonine protein kinase